MGRMGANEGMGGIGGNGANYARTENAGSQERRHGMLFATEDARFHFIASHSLREICENTALAGKSPSD